MIISFHSRAAQDIYDGISSKDARKFPQTIWPVAQRKMDMLNAAAALKDLKAPPANRLESLKGTLKDKYSIRINDQYRIVFGFKDGNAYDVEIVDYH
jgi:proteic killer suppression protein